MSVTNWCLLVMLATASPAAAGTQLLYTATGGEQILCTPGLTAEDCADGTLAYPVGLDYAGLLAGIAPIPKLVVSGFVHEGQIIEWCCGIGKIRIDYGFGQPDAPCANITCIVWLVATGSGGSAPGEMRLQTFTGSNIMQAGETVELLTFPRARFIAHRASLTPGHPAPYAGNDAAPLSVTFNGLGSDCDGDGLVMDDPDLDRLDFWSCIYEWDFGDPTSGTWQYSGLSKNSAFGAHASHVYETPGVYTVTLTMRDQSGAVLDTDSHQIEVDDPNDVWPPSTTECISRVGDFFGCPELGSTNTIRPDGDFSAALDDCLDAGHKRCLFRGGESWTAAVPTALSGNTGYIGSFPSGTRAAVVSSVSFATDMAIDYGAHNDDWRVVDMDFTCGTGASVLVGGGEPIDDMLIARSSFDGSCSGASIKIVRRLQGSVPSSHVTLYENTCTAANFCWFGGADYPVFLGNSFVSNGEGSVHQAIRVSGTERGEFQHNHGVSGHGAWEAYKIHCRSDSPAHDVFYNIISDNIAPGSGRSIDLKHGGTTHTCRLAYSLIERNWFGGLARTDVQNNLWRHNVAAFFDVCAQANPPAGANWGSDNIYQGNTCHGLGTSEICLRVGISVGCDLSGGGGDNNVFLNTLAYAPNDPAPTVYAESIGASGNVHSFEFATNVLPFVSSVFDSLDDYRVNEAGPEAASIVDVGADPGFATIDPGLNIVSSDWDLGAWCAGNGCGAAP